MRYLLAALAALCCFALNGVQVRTTTVANPDGTQDTAYPNGDKPNNAPTLACDNSAQAQPTGQTVGVAYSHNVRQYLTGTAAATATLALVTVSGDDAAANGWAVGANNLTNAGTDSDLPGSGILRVTATSGGFTAICGGLNWAYNSAPPSGTGIKWHPGVYPWYLPQISGQYSGFWMDIPAVEAKLANFITKAICPQPSLKGIRVFLTWASMEGDVKGNYTAGLAMVHRLGDALWNCSSGHKYLMIAPLVTYFSSPPSHETVFPKYLIGTADGGTDSSGTYGITIANYFICPQEICVLHAKVWEQPTADAYIDMMNAYGADLDDEPWFEGTEAYSETSFNITNGYEGFSYDAVETQMNRVLPAMRAAFPHSGLRIAANFIDSNARMLRLFSLGAQYAASVGGPDSIIHNQIQANEVFSGKTGTDFRGVMPWLSDIQGPQLCDGRMSKPAADADHNYTPTDFYNYWFSGNPSASILPIYPAYAIPMVYSGFNSPPEECTTPSQQWGPVDPNWSDGNTGGFLDFFQGNPSFNTTCPSSYALYGGCKTSP